MKKNLTPIIGLLAGLILVVWSITMSGSLINFWDVSSVVIVLGGSFAALVVSFPRKLLMKVPSILKQLITPPRENRQNIVLQFAELGKKARRDGLLSLEDDISTMDDEFLASGLQMVVDGVEPETIEATLELKMDTIERRHRSGQDIFLKWGELAPAFGMIGTLIGLILMLVDLDDPSAIGTGMAVALLTTFYGSLLANLAFIPIASNLEVQTDEEMYTCRMMIDGILAIQAGNNPRFIEERLMTYLSPEELKKLDSERDSFKEAAYNE